MLRKRYYSRARRYLLSLLAILIALSLCDGFGWLQQQAMASGNGGQLEYLQKQYQLAKAKSATLSAQVAQYNQQKQSLSAQLYQTSRQLQNRLRTQVIAEALWTGWQQRARMDGRAAKQAVRREQIALRQLRKQLRVWYEEEGGVPYLSVFFGVHSFSDLLFRATAMADLLARQKQMLQDDELLLAKARRLIRAARADLRAASTAYQDAASASAQVASQQLGEQQLFARVSQQKQVTANERVGQLAALQHLASQISAAEVAQARAAAGSKPTALTTAPSPASGMLVDSALHADLLTAASAAGVASSWVAWMELLVQYESSGNPAAVSPIAVSGEHASGLLQMLPDTFTRYALTGHTDIWNPVDNAIAAMRYIQANYGAPWRIPGIGSQSTYRGY